MNSTVNRLDLRQQNALQLPENWFARRIVTAALVLVTVFYCGCNLGVNQRNIAGRQAFESGQTAMAVNEFQQAIRLNPQNADAYYNLGATYYAMGKQQKNQEWVGQAEQLYRQAIALNDQHVEAHRGLAALLIESGKEQYAFDLMNEWKTRYPNSPDPAIELARLYQEYGDNRRATDLLADAIRLDNQNIRALKAMGHVRDIQGQTQLALDNYLRVLQIDNRQTEVATRVQQIYTQLAQLPPGANPNGQPAQQPRYGSVNPYMNR